MTSNLSQINLPFNVEFSSFPNSQLSCQNNLNVLPNGPVLPTRPLFPSSLPPSLSQYPSNMQTNFINVRREGNICNLRTSSLIVDSGVKDNTLIKFKNIPEITELGGDKKYYQLLVDDTGKLSKFKFSRKNTSRNLNSQLIDNIGEFGLIDDENFN